MTKTHIDYQALERLLTSDSYKLEPRWDIVLVFALKLLKSVEPDSRSMPLILGLIAMARKAVREDPKYHTIAQA